MEKLKEHYKTKIYNTAGFFFCLFLLCVLASPFVYVWKDFVLAFKVGITGFIGIISTLIVGKIAIRAVVYSIEKEKREQEEIEQNIPARKTFKDMLAEKMIER